jgi:hypothetical protein
MVLKPCIHQHQRLLPLLLRLRQRLPMLRLLHQQAPLLLPPLQRPHLPANNCLA